MYHHTAVALAFRLFLLSQRPAKSPPVTWQNAGNSKFTNHRSVVNDKTNPLLCPPTFIKYPPTLHEKATPGDLSESIFQCLEEEFARQRMEQERFYGAVFTADGPDGNMHTPKSTPRNQSSRLSTVMWSIPMNHTIYNVWNTYNLQIIKFFLDWRFCFVFFYLD